ncbi:FecCD family ABC transporter permease [Varunaivibrio sulfuroxidans]|uniref:Iron complex transport system permease protein n=1 Tax=Varunaivibrio sulfuroxidans TaxID=1773489 RepID=A0A4R3JFU0_9PROT|nr:iron ABC transporter permease [Varunaivibrio sulfuroxidans]TCS64754.1 iron complex transport system permease protein [Varunaivibrio sulfuroxidans]WES29941.1 iron ABC transporter permease [Varunaivibrio sulfuroxidans]
MTSLSSTIIVYRARQWRRVLALLGGFFAVIAAAVADVASGPSMLPFAQVWAVLIHPGAITDTALLAIVWDIRLPMTLTALAVGASLGVSGAAMQTILRNPLASPYTLGISAAAGFGAAISILFGITIAYVEWASVAVMAFAMAFVACLGVWAMGRARGFSTDVLVLAGIAMLFLFQSLQSLTQYLASPEVLQEIVFWLFGSLLKANWTSVKVSGGIFLLVLPWIARDAWKLTALGLGDENARSLGLSVEGLRLRILVLTSLLTAGAVAFVGTIGFVGLVAPHIARAFVGEDQRYLIPLSALGGAFIMAGASILSKMISPGALIPIGIVTAVIGVPFLFVLIVRKKKVAI